MNYSPKERRESMPCVLCRRFPPDVPPLTYKSYDGWQVFVCSECDDRVAEDIQDHLEDHDLHVSDLMRKGCSRDEIKRALEEVAEDDLSLWNLVILRSMTAVEMYADVRDVTDL